MTARSGARPFSSIGVATAALLIFCGLATSSFAAKNQPAECEQANSDLKRLAASADRLATLNVDHTPSNVDKYLSVAPQDDDLHVEAAGPLLSISPQVEKLLDDVFAVDSDADVAPSHTPASPLAEGRIYHPGSSKTNAESPDDELGVSALQRRMYRIDI